MRQRGTHICQPAIVLLILEAIGTFHGQGEATSQEKCLQFKSNGSWQSVAYSMATQTAYLTSFVVFFLVIYLLSERKQDYDFSRPSCTRTECMASGSYDFVEEEKTASPQPVSSDQLEATLKERFKYPEPHFVFLASSIDPERRIPWCPDTARALPPARRAVRAAGGTLFQINVGCYSFHRRLRCTL